MPLTKTQTDVLRLLAAHRDPRYSRDIDVFHDREERVSAAAINDAGVLQDAGYQLIWLRQLPVLYAAEVTREGASTRLEWVADSDFRFFPTIRDEIFGYVLHPADLAMNKALAVAGRREVRDLVDLVTIHDTILTLVV